MKKVFVFVVFSVFFFPLKEALAGCPTGYACLLKDVKQQEVVIQKLHKEYIENYFSPKFEEPKLKEKKEEPPTYKEIMPFSPRYY